MKKKKYLPLYYGWMATGRISSYGLCSSYPLRCDPLLELFYPTLDDKEQLCSDGTPMLFWGMESYTQSRDEFTGRRQTIVLFLAAMKNEL